MCVTSSYITTEDEMLPEFKSWSIWLSSHYQRFEGSCLQYASQVYIQNHMPLTTTILLAL